MRGSALIFHFIEIDEQLFNGFTCLLSKNASIVLHNVFREMQTRILIVNRVEIRIDSIVLHTHSETDWDIALF